MNTSTSIDALRRANPRRNATFASSVIAARETVRAQIADAGIPPARAKRRPSRRLMRLAAVGVPVAAVAAAVALSTNTSPGGEDAVAAVRKAAAVSAASAKRSGTAFVRITHNGEFWAGKTIRWNGGNLALTGEASRTPGRVGSKFLLVDGMMYGTDERDGGWVMLGRPDSIDPGSGTTPAEYLTAVREDVGGATLRRISDGVGGLKTTKLSDGSTVYSGTVAAGAIARKSGFKQGGAIRMLPFGYVAHGEAADPAAPLDAVVTVGPSGVVRELSVSWGAAGSAWRYTVTYRNLGATAELAAPADARPLRERLPSGRN
jgi:hypothetical protein